jgi:excisionase family DNA binding protein
VASETLLQSLLLGGLIGTIAVTVIVFVLRVYGKRPRPGERIVEEAIGADWLTVAEAATLLGISETEVLRLVARAEVPFFVVSGGNRTRPNAYRFKEHELREWGQRARAFGREG